MQGVKQIFKKFNQEKRRRMSFKVEDNVKFGCVNNFYP